jgi:hypothetical protein
MIEDGILVALPYCVAHEQVVSVCPTCFVVHHFFAEKETCNSQEFVGGGGLISRVDYLTNAIGVLGSRN